MSCPACINGIAATETSLRDHGKLCEPHAAEVEAYFAGAMEKHKDDDLC